MPGIGSRAGVGRAGSTGAAMFPRFHAATASLLCGRMLVLYPFPPSSTPMLPLYCVIACSPCSCCPSLLGIVVHGLALEDASQGPTGGRPTGQAAAMGPHRCRHLQDVAQDGSAASSRGSHCAGLLPLGAVL